MVVVHMLNNVTAVINQRIRLRLKVLSNPSHYSKAAHVVDVQHVHAVAGEIVKIDPVLGVRITREIERTSFRHIRLGQSYNIVDQRDSRGAERLISNIGLRHEQAGTRIPLQVLGINELNGKPAVCGIESREFRCCLNR